MKKKRSERIPGESGTTRWTRNRTRQQRDEEPALSRIEPLHLLKESSLGRSGLGVRRDPNVQSREMDPALEETLLAFLDAHGVRDVCDIEEDKLTFLDATYARCGVRADASVPTQKMFQAIYHNVQESESVELTMASFQLLKDLEKRHPRVATATEEADDSPGLTTQRLDVDCRVWSPIEHVIEEIECADRLVPETSAQEPIPLNLLTLVETIAMNMTEDRNQLMNGVSRVECNSRQGVKIAGQFLLLQHLISLIQKDCNCCLQVYEATMDISAMQKSYLYRLLCALPADVRKTFLSNLVFLLNPQQMKMEEEVPDGNGVDHCPTNGRDAEASNKPGLLPSTSDFGHLAYGLLLMVMEIDHVTRKWNPGDSRSLRRGSFPDDLMSIFSDARDLEAFLKALNNPWTKLRFIVDYFVVNAPFDIVVKGLKDSIDRDTIGKLVACFGEDKTVKFVHKFGENVLPLVLAHAFQASLIIHVEAATEDPENEQLYHAKLLEVSQFLVHTLNELRELERQEEMLPVAEHVIQMAEAILTSS